MPVAEDQAQKRPTAVMGVLNVTPDSFSDGGKFMHLELAVQHARKLIADGAEILDIGGESTRPGAAPVSAQEQIDRVCAVIERIRAESDVTISIDTSSPLVMTAAVRAGASFINDVYALQQEGAVEAAAACRVPVCLMHMQGKPSSMQSNPSYTDVVSEILWFLEQRTNVLTRSVAPDTTIYWDPGFCFGKTLEHNIQLLQSLPRLVASGYPVLIGVSRKSMLGQITGREPGERLAAGLAVATIAAQAGVAIIRTHDVRETVDVVKVAAAAARGQL